MDYAIFGFLVFYGMLAYAIVLSVSLAFRSSAQMVRRLSAALGIFLIQFVVIKMVLSQEANHPLVFIALGSLATVAYFSENPPPRNEATR